MSQEHVERSLQRLKGPDGGFYCPGVDDAHAPGAYRLQIGSDAIPRCGAATPCDPVAIFIDCDVPVAEGFRLAEPEQVHEAEAREHDDDADNAQFFALMHDPTLRWDPARRIWLRWEGTHWGTDLGGAATRAAVGTSRALWGLAFREQNPERSGRLMQRAKSSGQKQRLAAMVEIGKAYMEVRESELDRDRWVLNVANGTLDLRTGRLKPHDPLDLITRVAPAKWDPKAHSAHWDNFLETSVPDPEERFFLQRVIGYMLTGDVSEEKFFYIYGPGGSGKSTLLDAISAMLGSYSANADPSLFLKSQRPTDANSANPALVDLVNTRLATSAEPPKGRSWDEGFIKRLTGGDPMTTRALYGNAFTFTPQFKLLIVGNSRPPIDDNAGGAMQRRLVEIPFPVVIGDKRDNSLKAALRTPEAGAAILRWAVEGCLEWQRSGLGIPTAVKDATASYWAEQAENDPVASFLEEFYERVDDPAAVIPRSALAEAFRKHSRERISNKGLAERIRDLGLKERKTRGLDCWVGIRPRPVITIPVPQMTWGQLLNGAEPRTGEQ